ncbi:SRPBCC family protein [Pacificimonas sp. WHA3]|uniref:SRPBCC family protein n=1 Tax=Pacificimonas pallii TaxID=2827236 RepID=A0ABS6SB60_9SPHN|nr:SRPBCC family protein [Pacificimonas pallii]MBV7255450.1 SRPBCC family protein [Pacificimonas pallii]
MRRQTGGRRIHAGMAMLLSAASPAWAASEVSDHGFVVANSVVAAAPPEQVWAVLIEPSAFWDPEHGYSGAAENFSLEPIAGGCFCEALPDAGSAEHMRVVMAVPHNTLRLSGALGPLQAEGLVGTLTWTLRPRANGGTDISQTYVVGGHMRFPVEQIAVAVERVLQEQLDRLAISADRRANAE